MNWIGIRRQTARKQHKCNWCGELIMPGEVYDRNVYFDRGIGDDPLHVECSDAMAHWCSEEDTDEYYPFIHSRGSRSEREPLEYKPTSEPAESGKSVRK